MEHLEIDINNPFHPLNRNKYPEDSKRESFRIDFSNESYHYINSVTIDWGDGTIVKYDGSKPLIHDYPRNELHFFYRIKIDYDPNSNSDFLLLKNNYYIKRIMGPLPEVSAFVFAGYFRNCKYLEMIGRDVFKLNQNHLSLFELFAECKSLNYIDPDSKIPQSVTNLDGVLLNCKAFRELPRAFNLKSAISMNKSFMGMSIERVPMNYFEEATELTYAESIFEDCIHLTDVGYNPFYANKKLKSLKRAFYGDHILKVKDNFFTYINSNVNIDNII